MSGPAIPTDWKNSRAIVALVSGAATAVFFVTTVIPLYTKIDANEISALKSRTESLEREISTHLSTMEALKKEIIEREKVIVTKEASITELSQKLEKVTLGALFDGQDPYPLFLRSVRIGDRVNKVKSNFAASQIEDTDSWVSVRGLSAPFQSITYYKSEEGENPRIGHILLDIDSPVSAGPKVDYNEIVYQRLVETFGNPDKTAKPTESIQTVCWRSRRGTDIEFEHGPAGTLHLLLGGAYVLDCDK